MLQKLVWVRLHFDIPNVQIKENKKLAVNFYFSRKNCKRTLPRKRTACSLLFEVSHLRISCRYIVCFRKKAVQDTVWLFFVIRMHGLGEGGGGREWGSGCSIKFRTVREFSRLKIATACIYLRIYFCQNTGNGFSTQTSCYAFKFKVHFDNPLNTCGKLHIFSHSVSAKKAPRTYREKDESKKQ